MSDTNKKGYYAIIPATVRYDKRLPANAKLLYGELTALSNEKGYCWASNRYFADLYEVSIQSVSKWVSKLNECGYITMQLEYREGTRQVKNRFIRIIEDPTLEKVNTPPTQVDDPIKEKFNTSPTKVEGGTLEKFKDNNTTNNTINNTINKGRFTPPTLDKLIDYCNEKQAGIDPQGFIDFYQSNGWMVGKSKMKCWRSAVGTWKRRQKEQNREKQVYSKEKNTKQSDTLRNKSIDQQLTDTSWAD
jgi:DNA-binding transcriptional ArsR family regulator